MKNYLLLFFIAWGCGKQTLPIPPSNVTATVVSSSQVYLSWKDRSENESGFKVQRREGNAAFLDVGSTSRNITEYHDNGLTPNTAYTYRVYAYNRRGSSLAAPSRTLIFTLGQHQ